MCGILGWMTTSESDLSFSGYKKGIEHLFLLSETRGKEASGVCAVTDENISVLKAPIRAKKLIASDKFQNCVADTFPYGKRLIMGHARMVTNGSAEASVNNQPVIRGDLVCIHNGIIVNADALWEQNKNLKQNSEVDTEIFLALLEKYEYRNNFSGAFYRTLQDIEGSLSVALIDRCSEYLFLYTNTGSLYFAVPEDKSDFIFSSEQYILEQMIKMSQNEKGFVRHKIGKIAAGHGYLVHLSHGKIYEIQKNTVRKMTGYEIRNRKLTVSEIPDCTRKDANLHFFDYDRKKAESLMQIDLKKIHSIRRCTKCLLPETFPGITFDEKGVCSVCVSYKKMVPKGRGAFINDLSHGHTLTSRYDCIAPISGGRDSCYILHYLVKELHLKPVAYTYDWGLVTDLARRNIQRMCSKLGVEHILISADLAAKRENVRKNVEAWLKRPALGTVPLFMAGDKQFFYYAQLLKKQMRVDNVIFGMNFLEETQFKARFIRMKQTESANDRYYNFSGRNKIGLMMDYGKEFLKNPAYINTSLIDSFTGFLSFYAMPRHYLRFFDYIPWDQKVIEDILMKEYHWETAADTKETWRIGDGTAPFYNYIYYRMAGFTEFDTFKSNQIRQGMISREEALASLDESNRVSTDGFLWYCKTIGLDPIRILSVINEQKPLYEA